MTRKKLDLLLKNGENFTVEFKQCRNELNNSVFETVCSFSNRYGGYLFLGVEDSGKVVGVNPKSVQNIKKNFINVLNNPNKISPALFLNLEEFNYDGKVILWTYVPVNSEVELCDNKIFDRNGDADQNITKSVDLVANLFNRKSRTFFERQIFPYVTTKHLRLDLIPVVKKLALIKNENHPWRNMDDMEFFKSASLYEENLITGEKGFNLAAVLLFGKNSTIASCLPTYKTDAIFRDRNMDRYDDRLIVETNLIESYDLLMEFVQKHTDDRFFLMDNLSTSVRDKIAREVISNLLVHREFSSAFPAKLIIDKEKLYTENWNRAFTFGKLNPQNFTPYPKNPILAKFFVNIARADSLGSGVRNLYKFTKIYSDSEPTLEEGDVFKTTIPLLAAKKQKIHELELSDSEQKVLVQIENNGSMSSGEIQTKLGFKSRTSVQRILKKLLESGKIKKTGDGKNIVYEIN
ncbi:MAG: putative DNA binding domain-containing protein [Treponema sp.]|nr:putative DNA binding domain-containing protein [Treponema sp.]